MAKVCGHIISTFQIQTNFTSRRHLEPQNRFVRGLRSVYLRYLTKFIRDNVEPTYNSSLALTLLPGTGITNSSYLVRAQCSNCRSWNSGSLNVAKDSAFIYAVGPAGSIQSDDKAADMRRHTHYGQCIHDQESINPDSCEMQEDLQWI